MIKFFRRIRQKLLTENKFSKYLLYAIGEIVLVVIGILIALQINNWNQQRLNRNKEVTYLLELKASLELDANEVTEVLEFNVKKDSIVKNMMRIFESSLSNSERFDIIDKYSTSFTAYQFFKPSATAWNNFLSAENINLIESKDLRTKLMEYYDFDYDGSIQERIKLMNRKVIDQYYPQFFTKEYVLKNLRINTDLPDRSDFNLHRNQSLISDFFGINYLITLQNRFLENTNGQISNLIELIDSQIQ